MKLAAESAEVDRIFVNPVIKRACGSTETQRDWLAKVRPWWATTRTSTFGSPARPAPLNANRSSRSLGRWLRCRSRALGRGNPRGSHIAEGTACAEAAVGEGSSCRVRGRAQGQGDAQAMTRSISRRSHAGPRHRHCAAEFHGGMAKFLRDCFQPAADQDLTAWLFLKGLALVYIAAFLSLAVQIEGLAGSGGILPFTSCYGVALPRKVAPPGWIFRPCSGSDSSDVALQGVALAGALLALLLLLGWGRQRLILILLFVLYLSLYHAGQVFMNFQWDYLLLECGFLAIFLAGAPTRLVVLLYHWLLFRLPLPVRIFQAGERRPFVERLHHAQVLLRDPAAAPCRLLVCAPTAGAAAEGRRRLHIFHRADRPVLHLSAASVPHLPPPR